MINLGFFLRFFCKLGTRCPAIIGDWQRSQGIKHVLPCWQSISWTTPSTTLTQL